MTNYEETPTTYIIPPNYKIITKVGDIKARNVIEGICFACPIDFAIGNSLLLLKIKIVVIIVVTFIILIISIIGIHNESITQFCCAYIKFMKKKRILHFRRIGYVHKSSKRQKYFEKTKGIRRITFSK